MMKKSINNLCLLLCLMSMLPVSANTGSKKLPPCFKSPNCVSSQAELIDKTHFIAPFEIKGKPDAAWAVFKKTMADTGRMVITHESNDSLHAEATTWAMRFVDDVNVVLDADAELIHIRSASRSEHSDFGISRKRIEALRSKLQNLGVIE